MQIVVAGLARVQVYIDDVVVHSTSVDEHLGDVDALLQRFAEHGMKLAPKKMHVGCRHVRLLGHIIGVDGIRADPAKVQALVEMPPPKSLSQLRAWLGLANYFRRFIPGMAKIVSPLTKLMSKDVPFSWGEQQQQAMR
jgi:hypothetical protein